MTQQTQREPVRVGVLARRLGDTTTRELMDEVDRGELAAVKENGTIRIPADAAAERLSRPARPR